MSSYHNSYSYADRFIVASGDQAMPVTGNLIDEVNEVANIADGQIGVVSSRHGQARPYNDFLQAGDTPVAARFIKFVQGTPNSSNLRAVNGAGIGFPGYEEGYELDGQAVTGISAALSTEGSRSAILMGSSTAANAFAGFDGFDNRLHITFKGQRQDVWYSSKGLLKITPSYVSPSYTNLGWSAAQAQEDVIKNLAHKINVHSEYFANYVTTHRRQGNRKLIAFVVNEAGGAGVALSTIAAGTAIPVAIQNGVTSSYFADDEFVNTITNSIANTTLTGASTIEAYDMDAVPVGGQYDHLFLVALDHKLGAVADESRNRKIFLSAGADVNNDYLTNVVASSPSEGQGLGWQVNLMWKRWAELNKQLVPQVYDGYDDKIEVPSYIDTSKRYTVYIIVNTPVDRVTDNTEMVNPKRTIILVPFDDATPGATDATTQASLNTVLGPWLAATNVEFAEGTGVAPNYFV